MASANEQKLISEIMHSKYVGIIILLLLLLYYGAKFIICLNFCVKFQNDSISTKVNTKNISGGFPTRQQKTESHYNIVHYIFPITSVFPLHFALKTIYSRNNGISRTWNM